MLAVRFYVTFINLPLMSRIGKKIIQIPDKVEVKQDKNLVSVSGPKGKLTQFIHTGFDLQFSGNELTVTCPTDEKKDKALHGLYRSLINNMVEGVAKGFTIELELVGVGYKAAHVGDLLELNLGYSHSIFMQMPAEVQLNTLTEKGKNPKVILQSFDKQLIGQVASKIRSLRKVEPYKGKGVRFVGEIVRKKAGKTAAK